MKCLLFSYQISTVSVLAGSSGEQMRGVVRNIRFYLGVRPLKDKGEEAGSNISAV